LLCLLYFWLFLRLAKHVFSQISKASCTVWTSMICHIYMWHAQIVANLKVIIKSVNLYIYVLASFWGGKITIFLSILTILDVPFIFWWSFSLIFNPSLDKNFCSNGHARRRAGATVWVVIVVVLHQANTHGQWWWMSTQYEW